MQETVQLPESIKPKLNMDPKKIFMIASGGIVVVLVIVSIVLITVGNWNKDTSTTQGNNSQQYTDIVSEPISYPYYYYEPISYPDNGYLETYDTLKKVPGSYKVNYSEPKFLETKVFYKYTNPSVMEYLDQMSSTANVYKAGTISEGSINLDGQMVNLVGKDYLVAFIYTPNGRSTGYFRYAFDDVRNMMIMFDSDSHFIDVASLTFNLVMLNDIETINADRYAQQKSLTGNFFFRKILLEKLATEFEGVKVDSTELYDVYFDDQSKNFYSKSKDGFMDLLDYTIGKVYDEAGKNMIGLETQWNNGIGGQQIYQYRNIGICPVGVEKIDFIDFDPQYFVQTGVDNTGSPVYEYKDGNNEYLKKIYNEDYIPIQMHKYNNITEDDNAPFTYEEFLKYHPVFIWQDTYGNYVRFTSYNFIMQGGCAKPIVYLYPTRPTSLDVSLEVNGELTFTYPEYKDKWSVVAYPDGQLIVGGDKYDYLWWESQKDGDLIVPNYGFVVEKSNLENFFTDKLSTIGLNSKEIADFNEYWVQKISFEKSDKVKITFLLNSEVDQIAKLNFSEKIDSLIRVFMVYSTENVDEQVVEQKLPTFKREGFTVVEWGGALVNN